MSVAATTTPMPPSPSMRSTRYLPASVSPGDTGAAMGYGIIAPSHSAYELTDGVRPRGPGGFEKYRSPEDPAEIRDGHRGAASGSGRTKWPRRRARRHDRRGGGPARRFQSAAAPTGISGRRPKPLDPHALSLHRFVCFDFHDFVRRAVSIADLTHELSASATTPRVRIG